MVAVALPALLVVAVPQATGARRDSLSVQNVEIGPVPLSKGYSLRVDFNPLLASFASGVRPRIQPTLPVYVTISRSAGRTIERHLWNLKVAPSRVKVADAVGGIRIDTGGALGPYGRIPLTTASVGPVYRVRNCDAHAGRRYLRVAPDLGSFTLDASRGAPLVTGSLTMKADEPVARRGPCDKLTQQLDRYGPVTGSLTARFGFAGTRTITSGDGAVTGYK
jgi:hypothetical protein